MAAYWSPAAWVCMSLFRRIGEENGWNSHWNSTGKKSFQCFRIRAEVFGLAHLELMTRSLSTTTDDEMSTRRLGESTIEYRLLPKIMRAICGSEHPEVEFISSAVTH